MCKVGIKAIMEDGRYGMPNSYIASLRKASELAGGPIGVRPVSKFARFFIDKGNPTKPFAVKNKSSTIGPTSGLIAIDAQYGRPLISPLTEDEKKLPPEELAVLLNKKQEESKKLEAKHDDLIKKSYAHDEFGGTDEKLKPIELKLPEERLKELKDLHGGNITISLNIQKSPDDPITYDIIWKRGETELRAHAIGNKEGNIFSIVDTNHQPIQVMGRTIDGIEKPITADFDLLVVCPTYATIELERKWDEKLQMFIEPIDKTPFSTQGSTPGSEKRNMNAVIASEKSGYEGPREDELAGNWSGRIKNIVNMINNQISADHAERKGKTTNTVHHNAETTNPFADDLKNNVPCLFVVPKNLDLSAMAKFYKGDPADLKSVDTIMIESAKEMNALRNIFRKEGYYWPGHAKYEKDIPTFREKAVEAAQKGIELMQAKKGNKISHLIQKFNVPEVNKNMNVKPASSTAHFLSKISRGTPEQVTKNFSKIEDKVPTKPEVRIADKPNVKVKAEAEAKVQANFKPK